MSVLHPHPFAGVLLICAPALRGKKPLPLYHSAWLGRRRAPPRELSGVLRGPPPSFQSSPSAPLLSATPLPLAPGMFPPAANPCRHRRAFAPPSPVAPKLPGLPAMTRRLSPFANWPRKPATPLSNNKRLDISRILPISAVSPLPTQICRRPAASTFPLRELWVLPLKNPVTYPLLLRALPCLS